MSNTVRNRRRVNLDLALPNNYTPHLTNLKNSAFLFMWSHYDGVMNSLEVEEKNKENEDTLNNFKLYHLMSGICKVQDRSFSMGRRYGEFYKNKLERSLFMDTQQQTIDNNIFLFLHVYIINKIDLFFSERKYKESSVNDRIYNLLRHEENNSIKDTIDEDLIYPLNKANSCYCDSSMVCLSYSTNKFHRNITAAVNYEKDWKREFPFIEREDQKTSIGYIVNAFIDSSFSISLDSKECYMKPKAIEMINGIISIMNDFTPPESYTKKEMLRFTLNENVSKMRDEIEGKCNNNQLYNPMGDNARAMKDAMEFIFLVKEVLNTSYIDIPMCVSSVYRNPLITREDGRIDKVMKEPYLSDTRVQRWSMKIFTYPVGITKKVNVTLQDALDYTFNRDRKNKVISDSANIDIRVLMESRSKNIDEKLKREFINMYESGGFDRQRTGIEEEATTILINAPMLLLLDVGDINGINNKSISFLSSSDKSGYRDVVGQDNILIDTISDGVKRYRIQSMIIKSGLHYTACFRFPGRKFWYYYNDIKNSRGKNIVSLGNRIPDSNAIFINGSVRMLLLERVD